MITNIPFNAQADLFLDMLDPSTSSFCYRTFDDVLLADGIKRGLSQLSGNHAGTLTAQQPSLQSLNAHGAGVFVVINEGGQKKAQIRRVRAVFADTDGADPKPIIKALAPHMVVQSSDGNFHIYWLTMDDFPLEKFGPIQEAISKKFGTDGSVKDLSRVMRLPGFKHNKHGPVDVVLLAANPNLARYTHEDIIKGLGLQLQNAPAVTSQASSPTTHQTSSLADAMLVNEFGLVDLREMLKHINPWCERAVWMRVCFAMAYEYGEPGRDLFVHWSRGGLWKERHYEPR